MKNGGGSSSSSCEQQKLACTRRRKKKKSYFSLNCLGAESTFINRPAIKQSARERELTVSTLLDLDRYKTASLHAHHSIYADVVRKHYHEQKKLILIHFR
jgi:hypothetical protein